MTTFVPEMRIFDDEGNRLYLTADERAAFLTAANLESAEKRMLCHVLHFTGCRISEALELSPGRIIFDEKAIVFRTLKKRKHDNKGRERKPQYRKVPVPDHHFNELTLAFDLVTKIKKKQLTGAFWTMSRTTAWRTVKKIMAAAGITGPQATPKGLRHGKCVLPKVLQED